MGKKQQQPQSESEWLVTIKNGLDKARQDNNMISVRKTCIYRVPQYLREADKKSYIPTVVSIGPYHHNNRHHLLPMEHHKWRAFYQTISRHNHDFKLYLDSIRDVEADARGSYEGDVNLNSNDFVKMMVLDACFILELFRGTKDGFEELGYTKGDPVFSFCGLLDSIRRDMVKLENQIPMFVLDKLFALQNQNQNQNQNGEGHEAHALAKLAISFFAPLIPTDEPLKEDRALSQFDTPPLHCLQLFRESLESRLQA